MSFSSEISFQNISSTNQNLFREMGHWETSSDYTKLLKITQDIDIINIRHDCLDLLDQINQVLISNQLNNQPTVVAKINECLAGVEYDRIPDILAQAVDLDKNNLRDTLLSLLIEVCNVYRSLIKINNMPGHTGKPVRILRIPGLR